MQSSFSCNFSLHYSQTKNDFFYAAFCTLIGASPTPYSPTPPLYCRAVFTWNAVRRSSVVSMLTPGRALAPQGEQQFPVTQSKGILEHLGTEHGAWLNPSRSGAVQVSVSSLESGSREQLVDRQFKGQSLSTQDVPYSWVAVHLRYYRAHVTGYRMSFSSAEEAYPREWQLHGSKDGAVWVVLKVHKKDSSFHSLKTTAKWQVESGESDKQFYSHFRVLLGEQGNAQKKSFLAISCFELFGTLCPK